MLGNVAFSATLELLSSLGAEAIGQRILALTDLACRRLREIRATVVSSRESPEHCSGIVLFELPGRDPMAVRRKLLDKKIVASCRSGRLRISPHAYANEADVERLIEALRTCES